MQMPITRGNGDVFCERMDRYGGERRKEVVDQKTQEDGDGSLSCRGRRVPLCLSLAPATKNDLFSIFRGKDTSMGGKGAIRDKPLAGHQRLVAETRPRAERSRAVTIPEAKEPE